MNEHNYVYNYGFLEDWMKANPRINRSELLKSIGMQDYGTLSKWFDGKTMIPLGQMMKFCNRWNVPITAFFLDEMANGTSAVAPISSEMKIKPLGGWPQDDRKAGKKVQDPRTTEHESSALPDYIPTNVNKNYTKGGENSNGCENTTLNALSQNERSQYISAINNLTERIAEMSRENGRLISLLFEATRMTDRTTNSSDKQE